MSGGLGFGVSGLGLVGRGWCLTVWGSWVGVGRSRLVRVGLGLVGWSWSVVVCTRGSVL